MIEMTKILNQILFYTNLIKVQKLELKTLGVKKPYHYNVFFFLNFI